MSQSNIKKAVATSTSRKRALNLLKLASIYSSFDYVLCGDEIEKSKPDPEIFLKVSEKLGCSPQKCLVIEDSEAGIEAACKAGMFPIMIPDMKEPNDLTQTLIFKKMDSLLDVKYFLEEFLRTSFTEWKNRKNLKELPYIIKEKIEDITFVFIHYARKNDKFIYINEERTVEKLDEMFNGMDANVIFYGHEHDLIQKKLEGSSTYICVGSSGCSKDEYTYYTILNIEDGKYSIEKVELKYDREKFIETFSMMNYPDKDFISKVFFGIDKKKYLEEWLWN